MAKHTRGKATDPRDQRTFRQRCERIAVREAEEAHAIAMDHYFLCKRLGREYALNPKGAAPDHDDLAQEAYLTFYRVALTTATVRNFGNYASRTFQRDQLQITAQLRFPVALAHQYVAQPKRHAQMAMAECSNVEFEPLESREPPLGLDEAESQEADTSRLGVLLALLPPADRTHVMLAFGLGEEHAHTARERSFRLGITINSANTRLQRGMERLRRLAAETVDESRPSPGDDTPAF